MNDSTTHISYHQYRSYPSPGSNEFSDFSQIKSLCGESFNLKDTNIIYLYPDLYTKKTIVSRWGHRNICEECLTQYEINMILINLDNEYNRT